jgi:hypothetical protein
VCLIFLIGSNFITQTKKKSLSENIQKIQLSIDDKTTKKILRNNFWNESKNAFTNKIMVTNGKETYLINKYDLRKAERNGYSRLKNLIDFDGFNNNIQSYWETLIGHKQDNEWLSSFFLYFPENSLDQFNIKNTDDLKTFIEVNTYNNEDVKKQEEVKTLTTELNLYQTKNGGLTLYQYSDIRRITLICLAILFGILYVVRPLIIFIKGIFIELK